LARLGVAVETSGDASRWCANLAGIVGHDYHRGRFEVVFLGDDGLVVVVRQVAADLIVVGHVFHGHVGRVERHVVNQAHSRVGKRQRTTNVVIKWRLGTPRAAANSSQNDLHP